MEYVLVYHLTKHKFPKEISLLPIGDVLQRSNATKSQSYKQVFVEDIHAGFTFNLDPIMSQD